MSGNVSTQPIGAATTPTATAALSPRFAGPLGAARDELARARALLLAPPAPGADAAATAADAARHARRATTYLRNLMRDHEDVSAPLADAIDGALRHSREVSDRLRTASATPGGLPAVDEVTLRLALAVDGLDGVLGTRR